jgi:hypothetical protein
VTVACVLKTGGDFDARWVHALRRGVNRWLKGYRFVCLTDDPQVGLWGLPLRQPWPKWWAKLNLFAPGTFTGPVLAMDLDTLPVGDLRDLASYRGPLAMLNDFFDASPRHRRRSEPRAQSGVLAFVPGAETERLWREWTADPAGHMARYRGDGEWLHEHATPDRLQTLYPGQIASLKVDAQDGPPPGCRLVCGHGRPRFTSPAAGWAHELWAERAQGRAAA